MSATRDPLTPAEVDDVTKAVASELFDDPGQAGIIAAVMARKMNAEETRVGQDKAGASVLQRIASAAGS